MRCVALLITLSACLSPNATTCGDRVCTPGTECDEKHGACVRPDQLTSCDNKIDDEACGVDSASDGRCDQGVCVQLYCGDGRVTGAEECDGDVLPATDCTSL